MSSLSKGVNSDLRKKKAPIPSPPPPPNTHASLLKHVTITPVLIGDLSLSEEFVDGLIGIEICTLFPKRETKPLRYRDVTESLDLPFHFVTLNNNISLPVQ